jgi:CBS domain containing-hemolysin-like protein
MEGILTLEDIVETLLGIEIMDEGDKIDDMRKLARRLWKKRAADMGIDIDPQS